LELTRHLFDSGVSEEGIFPDQFGLFVGLVLQESKRIFLGLL
jgi:hypothetical protein